MHRRQAATLFVMVLIGTAILLPIALVIHWFPADASKQAHNDQVLYDVLLIASVPIFVIVESVVLYSVWKFRMRPGEEEKDGPPIHGNTRLEVVWTAAPRAADRRPVHLRLLGPAHNEKTIPTARADQRDRTPVRIRVLISDGQASSTRLAGALPPEQRGGGNFNIRSLDVIHSFFVPNSRRSSTPSPGSRPTCA